MMVIVVDNVPCGCGEDGQYGCWKSEPVSMSDSIRPECGIEYGGRSGTGSEMEPQ